MSNKVTQNYNKDHTVDDDVIRLVIVILQASVANDFVYNNNETNLFERDWNGNLFNLNIVS